jgi:AbrB family looped-hinge helix DNA binding protein
MWIVEAEHLGVLVVGPTGGTNGNFNVFNVAGGFGLRWTGMDVRKKDGSPHHARRTSSYPLGKMVLMKSATRVTSKGQVVIPKQVREQLRWASGTQLAVEIVDGAVRLTPFEAEDSIDTLYGCLKDLPRDPLADLEAEHRAEIAADECWQRRGP